jgi:hypothetical protein
MTRRQYIRRYMDRLPEHVRTRINADRTEYRRFMRYMTTRYLNYRADIMR